MFVVVVFVGALSVCYCFFSSKLYSVYLLPSHMKLMELINAISKAQMLAYMVLQKRTYVVVQKGPKRYKRSFLSYLGSTKLKRPESLLEKRRKESEVNIVTHTNQPVNVLIDNITL